VRKGFSLTDTKARKKGRQGERQLLPSPGFVGGFLFHGFKPHSAIRRKGGEEEGMRRRVFRKKGGGNVFRREGFVGTRENLLYRGTIHPNSSHKREEGGGGTAFGDEREKK